MVAERHTSVAQPPADRPAIPGVLAEHLEELAYLSIQRRKLLFSGDIPLRRLLRHAGRIEAHLDGLRTGSGASVKLCEKVLDGDDPWLLAVAGRVWIEFGGPGAAVLVERIKSAPPELGAAWKEVLRQLAPETVRHLLPPSAADDLPETVLPIAVDAWGWHGLLTDDMAASLTVRPKPAVRFSVARHTDVQGLIAHLLEDEDVLVRRAALWRLALQRSAEAVSLARHAIRDSQPDPFAFRILGLFGERSDGAALVAGMAGKELTAVAIEAIRELAFPEFAVSLLGQLTGDDEDTVATAMAAFESLVGRVLAPEQPLPENVHPAQFHWQQVGSKLDPSGRRLRGAGFPWPGPVGDEPMEFVWRRSLTGVVAEAPWLRREVPDGFFTGFPRADAVPGE